jgi:class 3 adenylate cyclase
MTNQPYRESFNELLSRYAEQRDNDTRKEIERDLWEHHGRTFTVLIVDMVGYTKALRQHGLIYYLSMIRRMQVLVEPLVEKFGGTMVKFEADNADARFPTPVEAIQMAIALNKELEAINQRTPEELDLHVSCGIDHGECLLPDPGHFYGQPVVYASKLGEDIARPGQILVTHEAMDLVPTELGIESDLVSVEFGGQVVEVHSVRYT